MIEGKNNVIRSIIKKFLNKYIIYPKIYYIFKNMNIDLIHTNSSVISIGVYLSKRLGIPHVWHLREFGHKDYNLKYIYNFNYVRKMFESADCLIAISSSIEKHYRNLAPKSKIKLVYNGINNKAYTNMARQDVDILNFCCVGLINDNKNQMEIIRAVNNLVKKNTSGFIVNIIGDGDKDYIDKIISYIDKNNLEKYVNLWGYRNDIDKILPRMQVGIIPSKKEAFGRVTVEYMMNKLPVIGSDGGGTSEIIRDNVTGYLYKSGNFEELSKCMSKYIKDKQLREKHGKNAFEDSIDRFTMEANTNSIYSIYIKLIYKKELV